MLRIQMKQDINILLKTWKNGFEEHEESQAFIEYSNNIHNLYDNIEQFNPDRKCKVLVVSDDMIADMSISKKHNQIVTELLISGRKLNISTVFVSKSYFEVPKDGRLSCTHFFIIKI